MEDWKKNIEYAYKKDHEMIASGELKTKRKARKRQAKKTPFPPWQTKKPDRLEDRFIRLGNSLLLDGTVKSLNHTAFRVYVYMILESGGNREFQFPYSKYKSWCSKGGFQKAIEELERKGFIEVVQHNKNLRKANQYRFSEKWKHDF